MLPSPNPQISSSSQLAAISLTSFISFTSFTSFTSRFCFTQTLPTFSTPSKHRAHSKTRNSIPFMCLLHTSLDTPGGGYLLARKPFYHSTFSSRSHSRPAARLTPFLATLTDSSQLAENAATLSPFPATLTRHVNHNPLVCHSYKKHPGVGGYPLSAKFLPCSSSARNIFRISSYTIDTKQTTSSSFRINTYEKHRGGVLQVKGTYSDETGFRTQKTGSSVREVPLSKPIRMALLAHRFLRPTCVRLGLRPIGWHVLRHTHATWLSESGATIRAAQDILGQFDMETTLRVYTHSVPDSKRRAIANVAALLFPSVPPQGQMQEVQRELVS
jgi:hypothetical protein